MLALIKNFKEINSMQKKLIALAVASLVSGGAYAQSSVTIWGVVDLAIQSGKFSDAAGSLTRMVPSGNNTNRIGFRGTEDLGNGMSANFVLEAQPNPDNGTTAVGANVASVQANAASGATQFWNRMTTVGLAGKTWGSVNMGRQYTPWFNATAANDVFWVAGAGSSYSLQVGDTRMNNSIRYDSVNMNGFTAAIMYGFGQDGDATGIEGTTATYKNLGKELGLKLSYANGPISLNYGYDKQRVAVVRAAAAQVPAVAVSGVIGTAALAAVAADVNVTRNQLNGSYDFKVVKLGLGWNTNKASNSTLDDRVWTVTAIAPVFGKDTIKMGYTRLNNKLISSCDATLIAIGYEHPMSKRTMLYGTYAKMTNDALQAKTFLSGVGVLAGFDPSAWEFGVRHSF